MTYDPSKVAFVDTETTGLDPERHRVWEVAVIVDGDEHVWQQQLAGNPRCCNDEACPYNWRDVDLWVLEHTGIMDRYDHATALAPWESIMRFVNLTRGRHLVGACPWFDSERLHRALLGFPDHTGRSRDLPWHYHLVDVETLAVGAMFARAHDLDDVSLSLPWESESISRVLGVEPPTGSHRHNALADARWAKQVFEAIVGGPA